MSLLFKKIETIDTPAEFLNLDDPLPEYRGNPLIGSLGPIRTDKEVSKLLTVKPRYEPEMRMLPSHLRSHAAFALREFFLPGIPHMSAVKEVDLLIRQSYKYRNPFDREFRRRVAQQRKELQETKDWRRLRPLYPFKPQLGAAVWGPPGTGKTLSIDYAGSDFRPTVDHAYVVDGERVAFTQMPIIKLNLFQDGSLKSLGVEFFGQAEATLCIPLMSEWGVDRATGNQIQTLILQACLEFNVGIIVLDEFQFVQAAHDGARKALNYIVRLMNCAGIAVIVIGTPATAGLLKENLAASRRFISRIQPFVPFSAGPVWDAFVHQMFHYQYVTDMASEAELAPTLLSLSGGIPDLAVKLFLLSQMRLFGRPNERLTRSVLVETSDMLFYTVQDRLLELKGKAPDAKDIAALVKKMETNFNDLARHENERAGGEPIPGLEKPSYGPIELSANGEQTTAGKIKRAGKAADPVAELNALGVVATL
jgi:hypothetical protein